ncbi:MAG: peptidylprolyl isomerase [Pseudohongiellaceae bacterium]
MIEMPKVRKILRVCRPAQAAMGVLLSALAMSPSHGGTLVRVGTSLGDYTIELLDDEAPLTVQNFLNYVNRDAYDGTYIHRLLAGSVVQGGGFGFELFVGPIPVEADPPVANEFGRSNTRGTVAMAKFPDDPNSATTQWFVNIADNSDPLDTQNEGFTVFGNVLGEGLAVLDGINQLPTLELGLNTPSAPYFTESYRNPLDFVYINATVVERFSGAPHVYEVNTGTLITSVSVDGSANPVELHFKTVSSQNGLILQAIPKSIIPKRDSFEGIASYSTADGRLRIPSLETFDGTTVSLFSNVVFVLSNPALNEFTLESFEQ